MDLAEARTYLQENHRGVLSTFRKDGSPQLSPITCGLDDAGHLCVSSRETAFKVKNLLRDPTASVCVFSDQFFGPWIQVDGTASVVHLPEAMELLVDYYRSVSGEHPDWDDYRAAMERERRVLVQITIERVGPNRSG